MSDSGYWYQTGIASNFGGTKDGFLFNEELWSPNGTELFNQGYVRAYPNGTNNMDVVQPKINITNGHVSTFANDWDTHAYYNVDYPKQNATVFVPISHVNRTFYPTDLLMEWYHESPFQYDRLPVTFSSSVTPTNSVSVCIDEWNFSGVSRTDLFTNQSKFVFNQCSSNYPLTDNSASEVYTYSFGSVLLEAHEFIFE